MSTRRTAEKSFLPACRRIFLVSAAVLACEQPTEPVVSLTLHGTVTEQQSGLPLAGVNVLVWAGGPFKCLLPPCLIFETESDASGAFSYASSPLKEKCQLLDTWHITVEKAGFFPDSTRRGAIRCVSEVQSFDFQLRHRPGFP